MKTLTFLLIILITPIIGSSQEWAPTGAKWHFSKFYVYHQDLEEFTLVESMSDTIINGNPTTHLTVTNGWGCSNIDYDVFMYQANQNEVYAKINEGSEFHMLYDFSAQPGDSWQFPLIFNSTYIDTLQYTVTEVGTIDINGHTRKILSCNLEFKLAMYEYLGVFTTQIIEGIGDVNYMFPWQAFHCTEDYIIGLRCYEDNIVGLYQFDTDYEDCEYTSTSVSTSDPEQPKDIELFPNPSSDKIYFNNPDLNYLNLEVISLEGKVLKKEEGFLTEISLNELTSGLYILRLVNSNGKVFVKQFVKQ